MNLNYTAFKCFSGLKYFNDIILYFKYLIGRFYYFFVQFNSPNLCPFINQKLEKLILVSSFAFPYRSLYRAPLFATVVTMRKTEVANEMI